MPIYIFACEDCGKTYEINASIKEKESGLHPKCPYCSSDRSRQLITSIFTIGGSSSGGDMPLGCGPSCGTCG